MSSQLHLCDTLIFSLSSGVNTFLRGSRIVVQPALVYSPRGFGVDSSSLRQCDHTTHSMLTGTFSIYIQEFISDLYFLYTVNEQLLISLKSVLVEVLSCPYLLDILPHFCHCIDKVTDLFW